jgi:hypothetical protein
MIREFRICELIFESNLCNLSSNFMGVLLSLVLITGEDDKFFTVVVLASAYECVLK